MIQIVFNMLFQISFEFFEADPRLLERLNI